MTKRDKYNSSGYLDMTSYLALKKIEREEKISVSNKHRNDKSNHNNHSKGDYKHHDHEFFFLR